MCILLQLKNVFREIHMNNAIKYTTGAILGIGIVLGVSYYFGQKELDRKEQKFNEILASVQKKLPPGAKQESILKRGNFSSDGIYKLRYEEDGESGILTINYHISHGFWSYISGKYGIHAVSNISGDMSKYVKYDKDLIISDGYALRDGSFELTNKSPEIKIIDNENTSRINEYIVLAPSEGRVKYTKSDDNFTSIFIYPEIRAYINTYYNGPTMVNVKDLRVSRDFMLNQPNLGSFDIKIKEITNELAKVSDISLKANATLKNNKYNLDSQLDIDAISIPSMKQTGQFHLAYIVKDIDKIAVDNLQKYYEQYKLNPQQPATEQERKDFKLQVVNLLKEGFSMNLEKLNIEGDFGKLNVNALFEMPKVNSQEEVSLNKNAIVKINMDASGGIAPILSQGMRMQLGDEFVNQQNNIDNFKFTFDYNDGKLVVNNKDMEQHYLGVAIHDNFKKLDDEIVK